MFNSRKKLFLLITMVTLFNTVALSIETPPQISDEKEIKNTAEEEYKKDIFNLIGDCKDEIKRVEKNSVTPTTVATLIANSFQTYNTNIDNRFKTVENTISTLVKQECLDQTLAKTGKLTEQYINLTVDNKLGELRNETITPMNQKLEKHDREMIDIQARLSSAEGFIVKNGDTDQKKLLSFLKSNNNPIKDYVDDITKDNSKITKELKDDKNCSAWSTKTSKFDYLNHHKNDALLYTVATFVIGWFCYEKGILTTIQSKLPWTANN